MLEPRPLEIFCGTGGVGKTTLAAARALALAQDQHRVLLITIDPARRLKDVLKLDESKAGEIETVPRLGFDAMLMNPMRTLERLGKESKVPDASANRILSVLFKPYGGMNEIMAVVEVERHLSSKHYDVVILDTPPGDHFIDFLESSEKLGSFFDQNVMDLLRYVGRKFDESEDFRAVQLFSFVVRSGLKKLLSYLEKVTGERFIDDFLDAISILYRMRESFLGAMEFERKLHDESLSNWYLVTSCEQDRLDDGLLLHEDISGFLHSHGRVILNKCLPKHGDESHPIFTSVIASLERREKNARAAVKTKKLALLTFEDVLSSSAKVQLESLAKAWRV